MLAIVLSVLVFAIWQYFMPDPPPPVETAETVPVDGADPAAPVAGGSPATAGQPAAAPSPVVAAHMEALSVNDIVAEVHSENGAPRNVAVPSFDEAIRVQPLWTWLFGGAEGEWTPYIGGDDPHVVLQETGALVLAGAGALDADGPYRVTRTGDTITATAVQAGGLRITKTYTPGPAPHTLAVEVQLQNGTGKTLPGAWVGVADVMEGSAGGMFDRSSNVTQPQAWVDDDFESVMSVDDVAGADAEDFSGPVSWFGMGDRYVLAALAPTEVREGRVVMDQLPDGRVGAFLMTARPSTRAPPAPSPLWPTPARRTSTPCARWATTSTRPSTTASSASSPSCCCSCSSSSTPPWATGVWPSSCSR